jgi:hypothetical protein
MSMLLHIDDQLSEVGNSGQQLQLVIAKDDKKDETSSTTSSSDDEEETENAGAAEEEQPESPEAKKSYQFSSGTRQLSQKEVEVLLAKGCLDAEEVRRLRTRLKEIEEGELAPPAPAPLPKQAEPAAKGQGKGKGPPPPGASALAAKEDQATAPAPVGGKGKGPPAPAGKGGAPPPPGGGGKGGPPAPPGKGKGKGATGPPVFGRKWHWKSLQAHESQSTIWSELVENASGKGTPMTWRVDVGAMQSLFKEVVDPNAKKEVAAQKEPTKTEIKVFDGKRAQNLAIGLMGLRNNCQVDLDDVARAVSILDGGSSIISSMEVIELIATLLPTPEEAKGLAAIPELERENLRDVERQLDD